MQNLKEKSKLKHTPDIGTLQNWWIELDIGCFPLEFFNRRK